MYADEDNFFDEIQPSTSGLTLSQMNNKSSVLCPETQDITSQYLALQQLDAHNKMISRAKGCVDTSSPKSLQSYRSVSSQIKNRRLEHMKNSSLVPPHNLITEESDRASSARLAAYSLEEDDDKNLSSSFINKAIQTGIHVSNVPTCKTAEKISWYLEALSLGELQSEYFTYLNQFHNSRQLGASQFSSNKGRKRIIKGDIMEWHRQHFVEPNKPFSPRILADPKAKSKLRDMRCYQSPCRKKKMHSSHSSDTFESYEEDENDEEFSQIHENHKLSDESQADEETLINRKIPSHTSSHYDTSELLPHYRRDFNGHSDSSVLNRTEEDKYLDFLSKVTEDILRSGVYSDKAIQQAFEFHMQFHKDDSDKEKLKSLLEQVLNSLKVSSDDSDENFYPKKPFLFSLSRPNTPPEKETSAFLASDSSQAATDINSTVNESEADANDIDNS